MTGLVSKGDPALDESGGGRAMLDIFRLDQWLNREIPPRTDGNRRPVNYQDPPRGRVIDVEAPDGTRLHTEVFGPEHGRPVVLSHGFTCAIPFWIHQINELSWDYRIIAFDHRGHGRSAVPSLSDYSLEHLADDLDAVLDATLRSDERAVLAGHSMGGITIAAWADRYPDKVERYLSSAVLINTATGDLVRELKFLQGPSLLADPRLMLARMFAPLTGVPIPSPFSIGKDLVGRVGLGRGTDPAVVDFVHQMIMATPSFGRAGYGSALANLTTPHLSLDPLTVPTMVIGSTDDRVTPIAHSHRMAEALPDLIELVEVPGGHCSPLEFPAEVTARIRTLAEEPSNPIRGRVHRWRRSHSGQWTWPEYWNRPAVRDALRDTVAKARARFGNH